MWRTRRSPDEFQLEFGKRIADCLFTRPLQLKEHVMGEGVGGAPFMIL
jgi:hypothetical protein